MTDTMKSIALDTLLIPGIRPRIDNALGEQIAMKGGIKYCNLWRVSKQTLRGLNPFNVHWIVQWRKWRDLAQLLQHLRGDVYATSVFRPSMHDAMPHQRNLSWLFNHFSWPLPQR